MSYFDLDSLPDQGLVAQYVLEHRASGHFLGYEDYQLIEQWLAATSSVDTLLVVLSNVLPEFFAKHRLRRHPPSLRSVHMRIMKQLGELRLRDVDIR